MEFWSWGCLAASERQGRWQIRIIIEYVERRTNEYELSRKGRVYLGRSNYNNDRLSAVLKTRRRATAGLTQRRLPYKLIIALLLSTPSLITTPTRQTHRHRCVALRCTPTPTGRGRLNGFGPSLLDGASEPRFSHLALTQPRGDGIPTIPSIHILSLLLAICNPLSLRPVHQPRVTNRLPFTFFTSLPSSTHSCARRRTHLSRR